MRYTAFATDYDGTIARDGVVPPIVVAALEKLKKSGYRLLLVTGREMDDIIRVFPALDLFDRVVAENGAMIYRPEDRSERYLAARPPARFFEALGTRGVAFSAGRVIVAAWETETPKILDAIRECGLDFDVIFNKRSVMVVAKGVNKASGLFAALDELGVSPRDLVAVGDAENDIAMLEAAGCGAAVADALESVKGVADIVLRGDAGHGVVELIGLLLEESVTEPGDTKPNSGARNPRVFPETGEAGPAV